MQLRQSAGNGKAVDEKEPRRGRVVKGIKAVTGLPCDIRSKSDISLLSVNLNVVSSFLAALMITLKLTVYLKSEVLETISHEMGYSNELILALVSTYILNFKPDATRRDKLVTASTSGL